MIRRIIAQRPSRPMSRRFEALNAPKIRRDRLIDRAAIALQWAAVGALIAVVATAAFAAHEKLRAEAELGLIDADEVK